MFKTRKDKNHVQAKVMHIVCVKEFVKNGQDKEKDEMVGKESGEGGLLGEARTG